MARPSQRRLGRFSWRNLVLIGLILWVVLTMFPTRDWVTWKKTSVNFLMGQGDDGKSNAEETISTLRSSKGDRAVEEMRREHVESQAAQKLKNSPRSNDNSKRAAGPVKKKPVGLAELASRIKSFSLHSDVEEGEEEGYQSAVESEPSISNEETGELAPDSEHALVGDDELEEEDEPETSAEQAEQLSNQQGIVTPREESHESESVAQVDESVEEASPEGGDAAQNIVADDVAAQRDQGHSKSPNVRAKATRWRQSFNSDECMRYRMEPTGHAATLNVGQGQRARCSTDLAERKTDEYRTELSGSIDISFSHKAIYVPVMKAASQLFQDVFRKRLRGRRIYDRELLGYLRKYNMDLSDFFVFTFVRDPLKTFVSGYSEVNKYVTRNKTRTRGFSAIPNLPENEPKRALEALMDIRRGTFHGLVPAHMYTQLWKVSRCLSDRDRTDMALDFIGRLDNLDADWRYVERKLKIPHEDLPVIHSNSQKKMLAFEPPSKGSRFSELTKQVCEYYKADFACFGYDASICSA